MLSKIQSQTKKQLPSSAHFGFVDDRVEVVCPPRTPVWPSVRPSVRSGTDGGATTERDRGVNRSRRVARPPKRDGEAQQQQQQQTESVGERGAAAHEYTFLASGREPEGGDDQVRARATIDAELTINAELLHDMNPGYATSLFR